MPPSQRIYSLWAPFYDAVFARLMERPRKRALDLLALRAGERVLLPGVGTGLDLPALPAGVSAIGLDFNRAMLAKAQAKGRANTLLVHGDGQCLPMPDQAFDAVAFMLILSVVPNGAAAFREGWRTLRPGGRVVIYDKFVPDQMPIAPLRTMIGRVISLLGTDPNRSLRSVISDVADVRIVVDEPSLLNGQYRIILLEKA
jgi:phosphatidylethanolamine/phosphatidyl-N-methylethanolamine N-methyltransferase